MIHLGDIYYSATPEECVANYAKVITSVFDDVLGAGKRFPVFTLAGNHDYYSFGYGFLDTVNQMNVGLPGAGQAASYFCLRSADLGWQFLAMDSSYNDSNPVNQIDTTSKDPHSETAKCSGSTTRSTPSRAPRSCCRTTSSSRPMPTSTERLPVSPLP